MNRLTGILFLALILQGCKDPSDPGDSNDCIISDLARLEAIDIFPADHPLNRDISSDSTDPRSDAIIRLIGTPEIHCDFGNGLWNGSPIGIPFILVCGSQTKIPVVFRANGYDGNYGDESDPGPYPVPLIAPVEGNGQADSHVLAVDLDNLMLYELYNASPDNRNGRWEASSGAVWDLQTNSRRPMGWTSADAAGLPILPLLIRYEEIVRGEIDHPIRFTLTNAKSMRAYTGAASHWSSGGNTDMNAPTPFGMKLRLKADFDITSFSPTNQVILRAMKKYGLIFADIGADFYIGGAHDERWSNDELRELKRLTADRFEVVKMGAIIRPD